MLSRHPGSCSFEGSVLAVIKAQRSKSERAPRWWLSARCGFCWVQVYCSIQWVTARDPVELCRSAWPHSDCTVKQIWCYCSCFSRAQCGKTHNSLEHFRLISSGFHSSLKAVLLLLTWLAFSHLRWHNSLHGFPQPNGILRLKHGVTLIIPENRRSHSTELYCLRVWSQVMSSLQTTG